jgi:hypothetical protein
MEGDAARAFSIAALLIATARCSSGDPVCPPEGCKEPPKNAWSPTDPSITFRGVTSVAPASATSLQVTWGPAFEPSTPRDRFRYRIDLSGSRGRRSATTAAGVLHQVIDGLEPNATYEVRVRALSSADREDENDVHLSGTTVIDTIPPAFTGAARALLLGGRAHRVSWPPAKDDLTAAPGVSYLVFASKLPGGYDYTKPTATVGPGRLFAEIQGDDDPLYFVVRAKDAAGNVDTNTTEVTTQSGSSFVSDVQPIFTASCAVPGCHVPGNPQAGMILAEGFAYGSIVNVQSTEDPRFFRVKPGSADESYLMQKLRGVALRGTQMPAPGTGNVLTPAEKEVIRRWIDEGATPQ